MGGVGKPVRPILAASAAGRGAGFPAKQPPPEGPLGQFWQRRRQDGGRGVPRRVTAPGRGEGVREPSREKTGLPHLFADGLQRQVGGFQQVTGPFHPGGDQVLAGGHAHPGATNASRDSILSPPFPGEIPGRNAPRRPSLSPPAAGGASPPGGRRPGPAPRQTGGGQRFVIVYHRRRGKTKGALPVSAPQCARVFALCFTKGSRRRR